MAKIPFSKLGLKVNTDVTVLSYNELNVEVVKYLPMTNKLDLITSVINNTVDDNGFYNPVKLEVFLLLEIISEYTNLNFTAKQKEDPLKLYDVLSSSGFAAKVLEVIGEDEIASLRTSVFNTIKSIYDYRNSVLGILESITTDYSELNLEASEIQEKLANGENIGLLKDILSRLG
jgi:hypothetical protein